MSLFAAASSCFPFSRRGLPILRARGEDMRVMTTPSEFYQALLDGISGARERITISALYLGTGELEKQLVSALAKAMQMTPNLEVNLLLDHSRALRGSKNSITMLAALMREQPSVRCHCMLYRMPQLEGAAGYILPSPLTEAVAVLHTKYMAFDDDVIITGANLSASYFTHRQDRYLQFRQHPALATLYHSLAPMVGEHSFTLDTCGTTLRPPVPTDASLDRLRLGLENLWSELGSGDKEVLLPLSRTQRTAPTLPPYSAGSFDTQLLPTLQHKSIGISWDEAVLRELMGDACSRWALQTELMPIQAAPIGSRALTSPTVRLATAYLNLTEPFRETLRHHQGPVCVLSAAMESHGFFGASGIKARIPEAYEHLVDELSIAAPRVSVLRYKRPGWTFHAKGLWLSSGSTTPQDGQGATPMLNLCSIGSSNFGIRSTHHDFETQLYIQSENTKLNQALSKEWDGLRRHAEPHGKTEEGKRVTRPWVRYVQPWL
ncbi:unnamed protein product [Chrysoparadoxa australica]